MHHTKEKMVAENSFIDSSAKTNQLLYKTFLGTYDSLELDTVIMQLENDKLRLTTNHIKDYWKMTILMIENGNL